MDPKKVMELIKSRRSVRNYKEKTIPQKVIDKILEAGVWAPSAMNRQPWRFVVITDKGLIKELSDRVKRVMIKNEAIMKIARFAERFTAQKDMVFYKAPVVVFVVGKKGYKWMHFDTGLCAQNMFLYAHSQGLGSCWIGFAHRLNDDPEALKKLKIPRDHEIVGAFIFGYPKASAHKKDRKKPDIIAQF